MNIFNLQLPEYLSQLSSYVLSSPLTMISINSSSQSNLWGPIIAAIATVGAAIGAVGLKFYLDARHEKITTRSLVEMDTQNFEVAFRSLLNSLNDIIVSGIPEITSKNIPAADLTEIIRKYEPNLQVSVNIARFHLAMLEPIIAHISKFECEVWYIRSLSNFIPVRFWKLTNLGKTISLHLRSITENYYDNENINQEFLKALKEYPVKMPLETAENQLNVLREKKAGKLTAIFDYWRIINDFITDASKNGYF